MQFLIQGPPAMEVVRIKTEETRLEIEPVAIRGQHVQRVAYVTASGKGGVQVKAVLLFNANTGEFAIQKLDGEPVVFAFDKPPTEFTALRDASRKASQKRAAQRTVKSDKGEKSVDTPETTPQPEVDGKK